MYKRHLSSLPYLSHPQNVTSSPCYLDLLLLDNLLINSSSSILSFILVIRKKSKIRYKVANAYFYMWKHLSNRLTYSLTLQIRDLFNWFVKPLAWFACRSCFDDLLSSQPTD